MSPLRALSVVAASALAFAACSDDGDTTAPTSTDTTDRPATTTTPSDEGTPDELVAVTTEGELVVMDAVSGDHVRTLASDISVEPSKNDVALTPDGQTAYFVRPEVDATTSGISSVPVTGGDETSIATDALAPSVSPDGSTLAYVGFRQKEPEPQPPTPVLVLRNLDTDEERELATTDADPFFFIGDTAWTADGALVAFSAGEIHTGVWVIDADDAQSLDDARRLGPASGPDEKSWRAVTALDDGRLLIVETCCDVGLKDSWTVVPVNTDGGAPSEPLLDRFEAAALDADPGADAILAVVDLTPEGGTLMRWSESAGPEKITDGVVAAAW